MPPRASARQEPERLLLPLHGSVCVCDGEGTTEEAFLSLSTSRWTTTACEAKGHVTNRGSRASTIAGKLICELLLANHHQLSKPIQYYLIEFDGVVLSEKLVEWTGPDY